MRDHRHQPPWRFGQPIVFGARIGAIAGLSIALVVAMITAVTVGKPLDQLLPSSIPHLIDGVAAGAAVGAVAVALRMRETLDPKGPVVRLYPAVIPHPVNASPAERSSGGALEP